jgi:nucleoside 2-deoxyribosyltransferase
MEIYIAAPFDRRVAAKRARKILEDKGHIVNATWIDSHLEELDLQTIDERWEEARKDLMDIHRSDTFVLLNNCGESTTGGMHIEFGFALGRGKRIFLIGEPSSIFHHRPDVIHLSSVDDFPEAK